MSLVQVRFFHCSTLKVKLSLVMYKLIQYTKDGIPAELEMDRPSVLVNKESVRWHLQSALNLQRIHGVKPLSEVMKVVSLENVSRAETTTLTILHADSQFHGKFSE